MPVDKLPIPHFRRRKADTRDLEADNSMLAKLAYMDSKNLPVDDEFVYESLGIPIPKEDEGSAGPTP